LVANAPKKFLDPIPSSSRKDKIWGQGNGRGEVGGGGTKRMREREKDKEIKREKGRREE
jgi:hypothetical protein